MFSSWSTRVKPSLVPPISIRARSEAVATLLKTQRMVQKIPRLSMTLCALHSDPTYHCHDWETEPLSPRSPTKDRVIIASPSSGDEKKPAESRRQLTLNIALVVFFGCAAVVPTELAVQRDRDAMELITLINYLLVAIEAWFDKGQFLLTERKIPLAAHSVIFALGLAYNVAQNSAISSGLPMSLVLVLKNTQILSQMGANAACLGERYLCIHNTAALVVVAGVVVVVLTQAGLDTWTWHDLKLTANFYARSFARGYDNYHHRHSSKETLEADIVAEEPPKFFLRDAFTRQRGSYEGDPSIDHRVLSREDTATLFPVAVGIGLMLVANLSRAVSNVVTQKAFLSRGNHYVEKLFYEHALGLPVLILPRIAPLLRQARKWSKDVVSQRLIPGTPPVQLPALWCLVVVQALCTFECTRASARVVGLSSAVTLALALAFQRFASIVFSALFINTAATTFSLWIGALLVVSGVVIYVLAPKPTRRLFTRGKLDEPKPSCLRGTTNIFPKAIAACV